MTATIYKILCVDDEPAVLAGLALHLKRRYQLLGAVSGAAALELLESNPDVAVIVSDMRMPGMNGAEFLARSRELAPDATRLLLTGQTDMTSAITAVNDGQLFRFLTKPCAPESLLDAVSAALAQHQLRTAEKVLLEQTLRGSINALMEVLTLANPDCFGRSTRIRKIVNALARNMNMAAHWQIEVAAMLSQIALVSLPPETAGKLQRGQALSNEEQAMVARLPELGDRLLRNIPRLEVVREIIRAVSEVQPAFDANATTEQQLVIRGAQFIALATQYDVLLSKGLEPSDAVSALRHQKDLHDPEVIDVLAQLYAFGAEPRDVLALPVAALEPGMILAEDLRTVTGTLLMARGFEVNSAFVQRLRNYVSGSVKEPVCVSCAARDSNSPASTGAQRRLAAS